MSDVIKCSFCPNTRNDVKKIIAGPDQGEQTVYICEECIEVGYRAISTKVARKPDTDAPQQKNRDFGKPTATGLRSRLTLTGHLD